MGNGPQHEPSGDGDIHISPAVDDGGPVASASTLREIVGRHRRRVHRLLAGITAAAIGAGAAVGIVVATSLSSPVTSAGRAITPSTGPPLNYGAEATVPQAQVAATDGPPGVKGRLDPVFVRQSAGIVSRGFVEAGVKAGGTGADAITRTSTTAGGGASAGGTTSTPANGTATRASGATSCKGWSTFAVEVSDIRAVGTVVVPAPPVEGTSVAVAPFELVAGRVVGEEEGSPIAVVVARVPVAGARVTVRFDGGGTESMPVVRGWAVATAQLASRSGSAGGGGSAAAGSAAGGSAGSAATVVATSASGRVLGTQALPTAPSVAVAPGCATSQG